MSGPGGFDPTEFGLVSNETATAKRRARDERLRKAGLPVERTKDDLLSQIDTLLGQDTGKSAEDLFKEGLTSGGDPMGAFKKAGQQAQVETQLPNLLSEFMDRFGPDTGGRVFRPSVMQQPSESQLFESFSNAAEGPAPDLLFRDVFAENFGDLTKMSSPYDKFVASKSKELEQRFLTTQLQDFNKPGVIDSLRADYEKLYRTKESGDFSGAGGSVPAFEDFIKQRVKGNFADFLQTEKPKLEQAFQLTSPEDRGQHDQGRIAPPRRIL